MCNVFAINYLVGVPNNMNISGGPFVKTITPHRMAVTGSAGLVAKITLHHDCVYWLPPTPGLSDR